MHPYSSEEIFTVYIFMEWKHDALIIPLPDDGHAPYAMCTEEMTLNDKAKQTCATTTYSSFRVEAFVIMKVARLHASVGKKLACWAEGFSTADLKLDNFGTSLTGSLVFYIHSSRLNLFCSGHLQDRHYFCGRRTVEILARTISFTWVYTNS